MMSRAFVNEDSGEPPRHYPLPPRDDAGFPFAAARALLDGANAGDSIGAEEATGYRWGDPRLIDQIRQLRAEAIDRRDDRMEVLAGRFLRAAGSSER
jgi:hypothetical protein